MLSEGWIESIFRIRETIKFWGPHVVLKADSLAWDRLFLIGIVGVESNWVHSAFRPPIDLLCQPRVITMMEKLVGWWVARETEVLGKNLPQCHFVHHKPHMLCTEASPGRRGGKPATNRLSYGTAFRSVSSAKWLVMSWMREGFDTWMVGFFFLFV
jgi:hypothetical protein